MESVKFIQKYLDYEKKNNVPSISDLNNLDYLTLAGYFMLIHKKNPIRAVQKFMFNNYIQRTIGIKVELVLKAVYGNNEVNVL